MNVHISYKTDKTPAIEREFEHQLEKLQRRLRVFNSDLVHFHAIVEFENSPRGRASFNLRLPSGQMTAQAAGETILAAVKTAFADLVLQVNKHKELLRGQRSWPNGRDPGQADVTVDSETPAKKIPGLAGPENEQIAVPEEGVESWISANLPKLRNFVER